MDDEQQCKCPPPGLPAWLGTFADLMSLLMCFFVLLLSFSEMDVLKFKQIAGSMKFAFGVQNRLEVKDIPKGTSIIAQEFRPGRPEPTPIDVIMQQTIDITQQTLEFQEGESDRAGGNQRDSGQLTGGQSAETSVQDNQNTQSEMQQQQAQAMSEQMETVAESIKKRCLERLSKEPLKWKTWGSRLTFGSAKKARSQKVPHSYNLSSVLWYAKSLSWSKTFPVKCG